jgi:phosphoglycolate phosphatase
MAAVLVLPARIRAVAFDVDGTLVDSAPDLAAAVNTALAAQGLAAVTVGDVRGMIGDGVEALLGRALARRLGRLPCDEEVGRAMQSFAAAYSAALLERGAVYPGVPARLAALRSAGLRLACVTNKAARFTVPLLQVTGLAPLLEPVLCAAGPADRKPAPLLLLRLCATLGLEPGEVLLVGDSEVDVAAARAAGCLVAAAAWGYTAPAALRAACPDFLLNDLGEVEVPPC